MNNNCRKKGCAAGGNKGASTISCTRKSESKGVLREKCMSKDQPVILIADDSENDVMMLRRAFVQSGVEVPMQVVNDGEEAIAYLNGDGGFANRDEFPLPDLLLLDLKMPRKNGFDVLEWIRSQPTLAQMRVVVLTSSDEIRDVNRAYSLGAASFLTKPVNFMEFKDTIQAMYNYWMTINTAPTVERPPQWNPLFK
jgi:CheY-like chemotaxis protein